MKGMLGPLGVGGFCIVLIISSPAEPPPKTGPQTEKRFPPLKVPAGFKATLFACDPLIEYPSAIAIGPRPGTLFVAIDYMTGLGTEIVRRDEIRLLEDIDGDGYADKATVFATGFNSIMGLAYHDGAVYVMHAPYLTVLRDTNGDGKADQRRDLLTGLGLTPEKNPVRLHCANGVVAGHDGWLYLALGDNGINVPRPEGDRLVLHGGGILRCRRDGRDLHVFATGLRNIYDVALDDELNVFVRDNENDGGDYMIRQCHSFFGADHGYPYLYYERPQEALPPLADLGLGSSAGGVSYQETAFPPEYRGNLFWCEWGRAVMRAQPKRSGSSFAPLKEIDFAAAAQNDPYGFKPTDLVVGHDGALFVSDWADGQRPKRGRGRIYRIAAEKQKPHAFPQRSARVSDPAETTDSRSPDRRGEKGDSLIARLDSASYHQRVAAQQALEKAGKAGMAQVTTALKLKRLGVHGRLHAVWILAKFGGAEAVPALLTLARTDPEPRVQAQAVRAVADLTDPVLTQHRLDAEPGSAKMAEQLAALAPGRDPRVLLEIVLALGRLRWSEAPAWLHKNLTKPDAALAHAAQQTLRRSQNWPAVLQLLDLPDAEPIRSVALNALADQFQPVIVDGLIDRLRAEKKPARRRAYADALTRVYKKPAPWKYWGYRPPPRPANTVAWERTDAIALALDRVLADPERAVRYATLQRMQREKIPTRLATLTQWLREDHDPVRGAAILKALRDQPAKELQEVLTGLVEDRKHGPANRVTCLTMLLSLQQDSDATLMNLADSLEDGPVLAEALNQLARRPKLKAGPVLLRKTTSAEPIVRAAAIAGLAELHIGEARPLAEKLLDDPDLGVRRAAAAAAGKLQVKSAAAILLKLARASDPVLRGTCLESLRLLQEPRAVAIAVAALEHPETQQAALRLLEDLGGPDQAKVVADLARRQPTAEILTPVIRMLVKWAQRHENRFTELIDLFAQVQGVSGVLVGWQAFGPMAPQDIPPAFPKGQPEKVVFGDGPETRVTLKSQKATPGRFVWLAYTEIDVLEPGPVQFLASSSGPLRLWLDGRLTYEHKDARPIGVDSGRFEANLAKGRHRLVVQATPLKDTASFHLRFRKKSSTASHEQLTQLALSRPGNADRGRKVFFDIGKSQCLKCHRLDDQGERIGPDLTGVGKRFARVYLIESILEPSRAIAPSYESHLVELKDGRVLTGLRLAETATTLTLGDKEGKKHELALSAIESRRPHPVSTMPDGLERHFTPEEFVDLIAFLTKQQ